MLSICRALSNDLKLENWRFIPLRCKLPRQDIRGAVPLLFPWSVFHLLRKESLSAQICTVSRIGETSCFLSALPWTKQHVENFTSFFFRSIVSFQRFVFRNVILSPPSLPLPIAFNAGYPCLSHDNYSALAIQDIHPLGLIFIWKESIYLNANWLQIYSPCQSLPDFLPLEWAN